MPIATINGLSLAYELIGESGQPWVITPGGRFTKESPGVRQLAEILAAEGNRVLIWDRPNCGESDVCFEGSSESAMQADALAGLLTHLDLTPAIIAGGSGGARVSLLTAARHPETAAGLAIWWISGGVFGLLSLATHYCGGSVGAAWMHGMEAVADLPEWAEVQELNPSNRDRFLAQDRSEFIATMERWMQAYCPATTSPSPGCRKPMPGRSTSPRWSSAAVRATRTIRGPPRRHWRGFCPTPASSSRRGATGNGLSGARPGRKASSPAGPSWPRSCWSGRQTYWADRPIPRAPSRRAGQFSRRWTLKNSRRRSRTRRSPGFSPNSSVEGLTSNAPSPSCCARSNGAARTATRRDITMEPCVAGRFGAPVPPVETSGCRLRGHRTECPGTAPGMMPAHWSVGRQRRQLCVPARVYS